LDDPQGDPKWHWLKRVDNRVLRGILSIQSEVVYGHVGNGVARLALQRLSHEVFSLPTVIYSAHPGHGKHAGMAIPAEQMTALIDSLDTLGYLKSCTAVLSGYLGRADQASVVADAVQRVKSGNTNAVYCCDPVSGDTHSGAYVSDEIAGAIAARLIPISDICTPNAYELGRFTDRVVESPETAIQAARELGPALVICTSVPSHDPDRIATLAVTQKSAWLTETPRRETAPHGAGDLLTAVFLGQYLRSRDVPGALGLAASTVDAVLRATLRAGSDELLVVQEQARIAEPTHMRPMVIG
jgi:pyridoxine kinase